MRHDEDIVRAAEEKIRHNAEITRAAEQIATLQRELSYFKSKETGVTG
jgi:cell fate (sporulation/competence/biofilm development) regulator YmcA (YheA/YmcA/DUF963 family)